MWTSLLSPSSGHIGCYSSCPYFYSDSYWMVDQMGCVSSQNCGRSAVSVPNSFSSPAAVSCSVDILTLNRVHCHVPHDRVPIPCCCYYFAIHPKPMVSWLSCLALTLDSKSSANQMHPYCNRTMISMFSLRAHAIALSFLPAQCFALPTVKCEQNNVGI